MSKWDLFWQSGFGKWLGIGIFLAATMMALLVPGFRELYIGTAIGVTVSLGVGGIIAGYRSQKEGTGFWDGFTEYINENWSQTVAISFATAMLVYGVVCTISAIRTAVANKQLANSVIQPADGLGDLDWRSIVKKVKHDMNMS